MTKATESFDNRKFSKIESLAVLEDDNPRSTRSSWTVNSSVNEGADPPSVVLSLGIRRGRLAVLSITALVTIVALTIVFNHGVELSRFEAREKNGTQQTSLLDDYNSYTGSVSSAFAKPLEMFVALAVQVVLLRFLATSLLTPELSWKVSALTLALSAGLGYLMSNGFNALNVQLRPLEVQPIISAADLKYGGSANSSAGGLEWTHTVSESMPHNPITNTILRSLVTPRAQKLPPQCNWLVSLDTGAGMIPDVTLDFGFAQRDWQARVLQTADQPKRLRMVMNPTNSSDAGNATAAGRDLPMNASLAADLFTYSTTLSLWLFNPDTGNPLYQATRLMQFGGLQGINATAREKNRLLPPQELRANEDEQRVWLLEKLQDLLRPQSNETKRFSAADMVTEYSHVDVSASVHFDAITFEFDVETELITPNKTASSVRQNKLFPSKQCGPWPAICLLQKQLLYPNDFYLSYDPAVQVGALALCANRSEGAIDWSNEHLCPQRSSTSLLIVSVGKRLVADSIQQNVSFNASATFAANDSAIVTNLRKIFSFTVGRLSWELANLTDEFHAECDPSMDDCGGLQLSLADTGDQSSSRGSLQQQRLVVGRDALPVDLLTLAGDLTSFQPRMLPLVRLNELTRLREGPSIYNTVAGDPLLPHNIKTTKWDATEKVSTTIQETSTSPCDSFVEDTLSLTLRNHMYMEHSLQPAYTAATFFLFQNGVVKDTIKLDSKRTTLNFEKNVQEIVVWVSVPDVNAWFTLGGCILLVACLGAVIVLSFGENGNLLAWVTVPHVIARVMLDDAQFPSVVLDRQVARATGETSQLRELDGFLIGSLALQQQPGKHERSTTLVEEDGLSGGKELPSAA